MKEDLQKRKVWILARPLSAAKWLPPLVDTSSGKFHLCHWGALIGTTSSNIPDIVNDVPQLLSSAPKINSSTLRIPLGTLIQLHRVGASSTLDISAFSVDQLVKDWTPFSVQLIGETKILESEIRLAGTVISILLLLF